MKNQKGFTLIEVFVVLVIAAILIVGALSIATGENLLEGSVPECNAEQLVRVQQMSDTCYAGKIARKGFGDWGFNTYEYGQCERAAKRMVCK